MKTIEELKFFFDDTLIPALIPLEKKRKRVRNLVILMTVFWIPVAIIMFLILPPLFILVIVIYAFLYALISRGYKSQFKDVVIENLVHFMDPNLSYQKDNYISAAVFDSSKLFLTAHNRYSGDDYVNGKIGETNVEFSELHVVYESQSGKNRTRNVIFQGLFFISDFNKSFKGSTYVLPDVAEKFLGGIGSFIQSKNPFRDQLIKLENPAFEKEFVVYGDDQVESRYILSPSLMERILTLRRESENDVYVSFKESRIYVAIKHKPMFEPKLFSTIINFMPIKKYYRDLCLAIGIVDELNLNTRVWAREGIGSV